MKPSSLNELLSYVKLLGVEKNQVVYGRSNEKNNDHSIQHFLSNQFYHIVNFPEFQIDYISPNIEHVLNIRAERCNIRYFYNLVHPQDLPVLLLASKKLVEFLFKNLDKIEPFNVVATLDFRLRKQDNTYVRVLNQNSLFSKSDDDKSCQTISLYSDITHFKSSDKIEFDFVNYGDPIPFIFPDEELNNMSLFFTSREREILSMLAAGKSSHEIGDCLFISRHTVDTHRRKMLSKSHLCNTAELVAFGINNQLF